MDANLKNITTILATDCGSTTTKAILIGIFLSMFEEINEKFHALNSLQKK